MKRLGSRHKRALSQLSQIADMMKERELAISGKLSAAQAQTQQKIAETKTEDQEALRHADAAYMSVTWGNWQQLTESRLGDLALEQANNAAAIEVQRVKTARAVGRSEILRKMLRQQ